MRALLQVKPAVRGEAGGGRGDREGEGQEEKGLKVVVIRWDVVVHFARRRPSAKEVMAVRRYDPGLRGRSIAEVREILERESKDDWTYRFSLHLEKEAEEAVAGLRADGMWVDVE